APIGVLINPKGFDFTQRARRELPHQIRIPTGDQLAAPGNQIDQAAEGKLDCFDVAIDIGVIELDVVQNDRVGQVVHELGPLIKIGGVVFIAFDYEIRTVGHSKGRFEVLGNAAYQESGVRPCSFHS